MKKLITLALSSTVLSLSACNNQLPVTTVQQPTVSNTIENKDVQIADIGNGKIGASFSAKVNFKEGFSAKANVNGSAAKTNANIASVDAYLIELASAPAAGSDPLALKVAGPINLTKTGTGFTVLFKNVPANNTGKSYYIGLVAKDSTSAVISKNPSTDWTGSSANKGLAISTTGGDGAGSVSVNASLAVSSTTDLGVAISLLDAVGAQVESTATVTNGNSTLSAITAS